MVGVGPAPAPAPPNFRTLVLSGGGLSVMAFVGCLHHLDQLGARDGVVTYVGTSAGAAVSLLCVLGCTPAEVRACVAEGMRSFAINEIDLDALLEIDTQFGLDDGSRMAAWLRAIVEARLSAGQGQPPLPGGVAGVTFRQLAQVTGRQLVVCVTNLTTGCKEFLSAETAPDMSVVTAVRMSMAIPLLYAPVAHNGALYVDGGLLDNFPVSYVTTAGAGAGAGAGATLALGVTDCDGPTDPGAEAPPPASLFDYALLVMGVMLAGANRSSHAVAAPGVTRVLVPTGRTPLGRFSFRSMTFQVSDAELDELVLCGHEALRQALCPPVRMPLPVPVPVPLGPALPDSARQDAGKIRGQGKVKVKVKVKGRMTGLQ
jgi:predicted acylesterase/phospholipase RssA